MPNYAEPLKKESESFLAKMRNKLLEITAKEIYKKGWCAAIRYSVPRFVQIRSTILIATKEYKETSKLSEETLGMFKLVTDDVVDFEKNTVDCFQEMEDSLRAIRNIFEKDDSNQGKLIVRHCDTGLWRIEHGKYQNSQ